MNGATPGIELVAQERVRQIEEEGWSLEHDLGHQSNELVRAAYCYMLVAQSWALSPGERMPTHPPAVWPWEVEHWKPSDDPVRNLTKAAALLVAEIDRLTTVLAPSEDA